MQPILRFALLAAGALVSVLDAQTVVPAKYATTEASHSNSYPFGATSVSRFQYLFDAGLVGVPQVVVKQLGFRGNGGTATAGKKVDIEIGMTTTPADPWAPSMTFSSNLGTDYKIVFTRKVVNLPAQPSTPIPAPFVCTLALDNPFAYTRASGNLLVDFFNRAPAPGIYSHDMGFTIAATITTVGAPCSSEKQAVTNGQKLDPTSVVTFTLTGGPPHGAFVHVLGLAALPVPIPLPLGGCKLYQDFPVIVAGANDLFGGAAVNYPLPPMARDMVIYGQFVTANAAITSLGTTQSHRVSIGGLDSHSFVYNLTSDTSPMGLTQLGRGIVIELR